MALKKVRPGNTIAVTFILKGADGIVKPSTLLDYHVYVYSSKTSKDLIMIYKKTPGAGEGQIVVVDDDLGSCKIVLNPSLTRTLEGQVIYIEVATQATASAEYENSKFNDGKTGIVICEIDHSANPGGDL